MSGSSHLAMGGGAEFDAIRRLLATWDSQAIGIGDDAAILDVPAGERLVVSTDASLEGVHFRRDWLTPEEIGGRAAAAALSDLAAMAATPLGLLVALGLPHGWRDELEGLARGIGAIASRVGCPIVGGNITASGELSLTITVLGSAARPLSRSGAQPGDIMFVTGALGGPRAALEELTRDRAPAPAHRVRFANPEPRIRAARWLAEQGAHAAIDISDGLVADASHLARASGVTIALNEDVVLRVEGATVEDALRGGEEYELLVAMPSHFAVDSADFARRFGIAVTAIGVVQPAGDAAITLRHTTIDRASGHDQLADS